MPSVRLLIVIATYNEIENLPRLVEELKERLPDADLLIIDDNSPDGTGRWCQERAEQDPRFHVIVRQGKLGLGSAAVCGFQFAIERDYDLIATMDADFSHSPQAMQEMVELIREPASEKVGVLLGSRYVAGGKIEGWPVYRRIASRGVNGLARLMLGLKTRDNSGAFRVYRRESLLAIDVSRIQSSGYAYLEELIWRLKHANVKMVEYPIVFRDRTQGQSKANLMIGVSVFRQLVRFAFSKP